MAKKKFSLFVNRKNTLLDDIDTCLLVLLTNKISCFLATKRCYLFFPRCVNSIYDSKMNSKDKRKRKTDDYDRPFQIKDVFSRLFKTAVDIIVVFSVIILIVGFLPENKNFPIEPVHFDNEHLYNGLQNLQWNDDLVTKSKFIAQDQLFGPESLVDIDDYIYTGVLGGRIVRVHKINHKVEEVVRFKNTEECRKLIFKCFNVFFLIFQLFYRKFSQIKIRKLWTIFGFEKT